MIFVILGIAVLIASFLIALISLIKEQGKAQDEVDLPLKSKTPGTGKATTKVGLTSGVDASKLTSELVKPVVNRELFPWEEGKYKTASPEIEADRAKIEVLKSQLADLKSRAAVENSDQVPEEVPAAMQGAGDSDQVGSKPRAEARSEPGVQARQLAQKLSGEVSIADLKGN